MNGNMHPYTTDSKERKTIYFFLAVIGILAALALGRIVQNTKISIPWWLDTPAVLGFYGLMYALFDKLLWKKSVFQKSRIVKTPDLSGSWIGYVTSSFDEFATQHQASLEIRQTWTEILIRLETNQSTSSSLIGGIFTTNTDAPLLSYEYRNEPKATAVVGMHGHRGTAHLNLRKVNGNDVLDGEYYTGRDRREIGRLHFERVRYYQSAHTEDSQH